MKTDYNMIAQQYKTVVDSLDLMKYAEEYSFLKLLGDLGQKSTLDLACGEGRLTRIFKQRGAQRTVGMDLSPEMVALAMQHEREDPLGIEYLVGDASETQKIGDFDIVTAIFLLDYAASLASLKAMCHTAYHNLNGGGQMIAGINATPLVPPHDTCTRNYGYRVDYPQELHDGQPVTYTFFTENQSVTFTKFHWAKEVYEQALSEAGFTAIKWVMPHISPEGTARYGKAFWDDYRQHPSFVCLVCRK